MLTVRLMEMQLILHYLLVTVIPGSMKPQMIVSGLLLAVFTSGNGRIVSLLLVKRLMGFIYFNGHLPVHFQLMLLLVMVILELDMPEQILFLLLQMQLIFLMK